MPSTDTPVGTAVALLQAVQKQTTTVETFKDEQIGLYTSQANTVTVTDADGNPVSIPSWHAVELALIALQAGDSTMPNVSAGLIVWDGASTETSKPFKLATLDPVAYVNGMSLEIVPTLDSTNLIVSSTTSSLQDGEHPSVEFVFAGGIPRAGKLWFTVTPTFTNTSAGLTLTIANPNVTASALASITLAPNHASIKDIAGTVELDSAAALSPVALVCIDVGGSTVSLYDAAGLVGTINVSMLNNVSALAGATVTGSLNVSGGDFTAKFNSLSPATSPVMIPPAYVGLTLITAVPPVIVTPGQFLLSLTDTNYNGYYLQSYRMYITGLNNGAALVYQSTDLSGVLGELTTLQSQATSFGTEIATLNTEVAALQARPSGGGGGSVLGYDVATGEITVPFQLSPYGTDASMLTVPPPGVNTGGHVLINASVDETGLIVSPVLMQNSQATNGWLNSFTIDGMLPSKGKYWMELTASEATGDGSAWTLYFTQTEQFLNPNIDQPSAQVAIFTLYQSDQQVGMGAGNGDYNQITQTAMVPLTVLINIDDNIISVYSNGLLGSFPLDRDAYPLSGALMVGTLLPSGGMFNLTANVSTATSDVPEGYAPLQMVYDSHDRQATDGGKIAYGNPYFSHVWLNNDGTMLGGFSTLSNSLWLANGGFIGDDIAALNSVIQNFNVPAIPTYPKVDPTSVFGTLLTNSPTTAGGQNQRYSLAVAMPDVYLNGNTYSVGIRAWDGALEVLGRDVLSELNYLRNGGNHPKALAKATWLWIVGDDTVLGDNAYPISQHDRTDDTRTSTAFATLVGAIPMLVSITGRMIAAGGTAVAVTGINVIDGSGNVQSINPFTTGTIANNQKCYGWLNGIYGTLDGTTPTAITFKTQYPLAEALQIPDNCPFIVDTNSPVASGYVDGHAYSDSIAVISVGRNNLGDVATIKRDIVAMVEALSAIDKRFIIATPVPFAADDNTTANGLAIIALEQWAAFTYPRNTLITRQYLQNYSNGGSDGTGYLSTGILPASLYASATTLTSTAQSYVATAITALIANRGWS
jgi:hypothetical protein